MSQLPNYRHLRVWHSGLQLVDATYALTAAFPRDERYVLSAQMRRAAISIPSNIAEGNCRDSAADHRRFITIARGSVGELDTQLEIAFRQGFAVRDQAAPMIELMDHVGRMLYNLRRNAPYG